MSALVPRPSSDVAVPAERVSAGLAKVMARGLERAEELGLAEVVGARIVGGHVQVSLEFADAMQWWQYVMESKRVEADRLVEDSVEPREPASFVHYREYEDGYAAAQISGRFGGRPWVLSPVQVVCDDVGGWCKRCADLGSTTVRVNGAGEIVPRDYPGEIRRMADRHRDAIGLPRKVEQAAAGAR